MENRRFVTSLLAAGLAFGLLAAPSFAHEHENRQVPKAMELRDALRDVWDGHIFWVRSVVVSTRYGDGDAAKVAEAKVVENAKSLAASIVPFYGKDAGDKLFGLLAGHYGAVKDYMTAAYANDAGAKRDALEKLKGNAGEIAAFLSSANPNWPKDTLLSLLAAHGGHHVAQIDAVAAKDFASEAETWGMMQKHMHVIADALADGIVKQFPDKF